MKDEDDFEIYDECGARMYTAPQIAKILCVKQKVVTQIIKDKRLSKAVAVRPVVYYLDDFANYLDEMEEEK